MNRADCVRSERFSHRLNRLDRRRVGRRDKLIWPQPRNDCLAPAALENRFAQSRTIVGRQLSVKKYDPFATINPVLEHWWW